MACHTCVGTLNAKAVDVKSALSNKWRYERTNFRGIIFTDYDQNMHQIDVQRSH